MINPTNEASSYHLTDANGQRFTQSAIRNTQYVLAKSTTLPRASAPSPPFDIIPLPAYTVHLAVLTPP